MSEKTSYFVILSSSISLKDCIWRYNISKVDKNKLAIIPGACTKTNIKFILIRTMTKDEFGNDDTWYRGSKSQDKRVRKLLTTTKDKFWNYIPGEYRKEWVK